MITVISGTNRVSSHTSRIASIYHGILKEHAPESQFFDLAGLPSECLLSEVYDHADKPHQVQKIQDEIFIPSSKFIFIIPEYNGSFPGVLKLLIDGMDPRPAFRNKKAALVGVSTGRAGNIRGMDHLSSVLHHMQVTVMPYLLPVSSVHKFQDDEKLMKDTLTLFQQHIRRFIDF